MLTFISLCEKSDVEKLGYKIKFQEAVQSSNAVSSWKSSKYCKRQYGSDCIVLWLKDLFWSKGKIANLFLTKILLKGKRAGPDQIRWALF